MQRGVKPNGAGDGGETSGSTRRLFGKLFYVGLGVKRWLLLSAVGIAISAVGLAFLIKNVFSLAFPDLLPWYLEGVVLAIFGAAAILAGVFGLYRSVGPLLFSSASLDTLADTIYTRRSRGRGAKVAVIGGGTGLSVLLRGLKAYTDNLTAIVTVADDGGSSGRLRREMGVLPPGDFRNCLVALSDDEPLVSQLFQYRFEQGNGLEGHSFGNLFIVAMSNVTGSFEEALYESSRVLKVHGRILPATVASLSLLARLEDGTMVRGESAISEFGRSIDHIMIEPRDAEAYVPAVEAIEQAGLIVMGPGSLYTSVLPNLLVKGIASAIGASDALKIYVCNVATQPGETVDYSAEDHVEALQAHAGPSIVDIVIANDPAPEIGPEYAGRPVRIDGRAPERASVVTADLVDHEHPVRHDSAKLAQLIMDVYHGKRSAAPSRRPAHG